MTTPSITCPSCGAAASGNFCSQCGGPLGPRRCGHCAAELSSQARFCHRCGRAVVPGLAPGRFAAGPARSDRGPWMVAAAIVLLLVGAIVWKVETATPAPTAPDMANTGAESAAPLGAEPVRAGGAPDISRMSPRERFDRLFNRVMTAAERGDTVTVTRFTPMALGAYAQLDTVDADARYHAATLRLQVGDFPGALALADTILADRPGHLFGYLIRGQAARLRGDRAAERRAARDFLQHYDAEVRAGAVEYQEHTPALQQFKQEAETAVNGKR